MNIKPVAREGPRFMVALPSLAWHMLVVWSTTGYYYLDCFFNFAFDRAPAAKFEMIQNLKTNFSHHTCIKIHIILYDWGPIKWKKKPASDAFFGHFFGFFGIFFWHLFLVLSFLADIARVPRCCVGGVASGAPGGRLRTHGGIPAKLELRRGRRYCIDHALDIRLYCFIFS